MESASVPFTAKSNSMSWSRWILGFAVLLSGCGVYSFNGASIPPDTKTVSIAYISNNARLVNPTLSQNITEKIKTKFVRETRLNLVPSGGDFDFSGIISDYNIAPVALQGNQQTAASKNRLTITAQIKFINRKDEKANFQQAFIGFAEFDASQNFNSLEPALVEEATNMMVQEIFNNSSRKLVT